MRLLIGLVASLLTAACAPQPALAAERPNILFCFADDWGRYASIYADPTVNGRGSANDLISTPNIDRIAREGVLFRNAFVTAPSCTPCRSSLLSGQYFYRTGRGAILQGAVWDSQIPSYPLLLQDAGYHIGKLYKVWGPGEPANAPYGGDSAGFEQRGGPNFNSFSQTATEMVASGKSVAEAKAALLDKVHTEFQGFLAKRQPNQPFCFWFGPTNVHRKWTKGSGKALWNLEPEQLKGKLPAFLPDVPEVREDFADYLGEAMAFDAGVGVLLRDLEAAGELDNTLVVASGDHGAPGFPRGKCNLYTFGTGVTLAAMWKGQGGIPAGRVLDDFVNLMDLAPTFLAAGGVTPPAVMTGRSLLPMLQSTQDGLVDTSRTWVVNGRERHVAAAREDNLPYPQRAIRTRYYLYIINFHPERWPMGAPYAVTEDNTPSLDALTNDTFVAFGDLDASPTKAWMVAHREETEFRQQYEWGFAKRPATELYYLPEDPDEVHNVSGQPEFAHIERRLRDQLMAELTTTGDPRVTSADPVFEHAPFTNPEPARKRR